MDQAHVPAARLRARLPRLPRWRFYTHAILLPALAAWLLLAHGACRAAGGSETDPALQNLPPEFDLSLLVQSPTGQGSVRVAFNRRAGQEYDLVALPDRVALVRSGGSGETTLAAFTGGGLADSKKAPLKLTVKRREGVITVLGGPRLLMVAEDSSLSGGDASVTASGGASVTDVRVQPIEPVYFTDDFMRQPNETGEWSYLKGSWKIQTIGIVQQGANPFSLESIPDPMAIASAGYPFWSDYLFQAAAKGGDSSSLGICAGVQDQNNYYLLRWSPGPQGELDLLRVVYGEPRVLARRPGGFIPDIWYSLGLRMAGGHLIAEVDHQPALQAVDSTFGQGKVGLYSEGTAGKKCWFDSVEVHPAQVVFDNFAAASPHHWQVQDEKALGGDPAWTDYTVSADVAADGKEMGLPFRVGGPGRYYVFTSSATTSRLIAVVDGAHRLLAETATGMAPGTRHRVEAGAQGGYLWGAIDGKKVVEALDFDLPAGRAGYQPASAGGSTVKSVLVQAPDPPESTDALTAEFTNVDHHREMRGWAGPLNGWEPESFGGESGFWHKGNLFGDTTVTIPLSPQALKSSKFSLLFNADGKNVASGYELQCSTSTDGVSLALLRQGTAQVSATVKLPAETQAGCSLVVHREGAFLYALLDDKPALRYHDSHPLDGYSLPQPVDFAPDDGGHSKLGLVLHGSTSLDIPRITVENRHVYAETFHLAPVNWRPQSGDWEVTRRWACQPGWTWYGGKDAGYAANWYKSPLWGDQTIDYYTGAMMAAEDNAGTEAWRDLNCSFCADGVNLFSGYTLIVQGWNGAATRLFRKGQKVAESTAFQFPVQGVAHRLWFDVHIRRQGGQIQVVVSYYSEDGQQHVQPLIDWTDPDPLPGGFVGYWTYDNGMMLARTVLCSQQTGQRPLFSADKTWLGRLPASTPYPTTTSSGSAAALPAVDLASLAPQPADELSHLVALPPAEAAPAENIPLVTPPAAPGTTQPPAAGSPPTTVPAGASVAVASAPVDLQDQDLALTVDPGGLIHSVRYKGRELVRRIEMDVRTNEWHQVKLTPENTHILVTHGQQPGLMVEFHAQRPEDGIDISGKLALRILPDNTLRIQAITDPASSFQSKRISINLVLPSSDYNGRSFLVNAAAGGRVITVPDQPLYPIQFATQVRRLAFRDTGIVIRPLEGIGVLEDLRHYGMGEFWYEQEADYAYPQVNKGAQKTLGIEVHFVNPEVLNEP